MSYSMLMVIRLPLTTVLTSIYFSINYNVLILSAFRIHLSKVWTDEPAVISKLLQRVNKNLPFPDAISTLKA
jgi:hypothetical protein